jgi:hypothetical protein
VWVGWGAFPNQCVRRPLWAKDPPHRGRCARWCFRPQVQPLDVALSSLNCLNWVCSFGRLKREHRRYLFLCTFYAQNLWPKHTSHQDLPRQQGEEQGLVAFASLSLVVFYFYYYYFFGEAGDRDRARGCCRCDPATLIGRRGATLANYGVFLLVRPVLPRCARRRDAHTTSSAPPWPASLYLLLHTPSWHYCRIFSLLVRLLPSPFHLGAHGRLR